jgi:hypothetical protein
MEAGADSEPASRRGTQAEYARHRGVSREAVRQAVRDGRIALGDDGLIDFAAEDEAWEQNTDTTKPRNSVTGEPRPGRRQAAATTTLAKHKATHEEWRAKQARLDYRKASGDLVSRREAEQRFEEVARRARQRLEAIPDRLAAMLAAEADPAEVHRLLREEIRVACSELADASDEDE